MSAALSPAQTVLLGDEYLRLLKAGKLTDSVSLIKALANKWFRLNTLYTIRLKEPVNGKALARFKPNSAQRKRFTEGHNRAVILKARQLGFTTFEMIDALDDCLFTPHYIAGCIAHTRDDASDIFDNKVKVAYEHIPEAWRQIFDRIGLDFPHPISDQAGGYEFSNGSQISVGVSFRGGTLNRLHVSEFGKICRKFPDKAREVVTGAFEAVPRDGMLTIESTAEGREGYFFDYSETARKHRESGKPLGSLDFQFLFFPWFEEPEYRIAPTGVVITEEMTAYFNGLKAKLGITIDASQRAWYVKKRETLQDDMQREYPSTPQEAFEQSIQGAYFAEQMTLVRKRQQIGSVPYDPRLPVHTAWDLGRNDAMAIWFFQYAWGQYRMIRYHEDSGQSLQHYLRYLRTLEYVYGTVYLPHDASVVDLTSADNKSRADIVRSAGFIVETVPRVPDLRDAIQACRSVIPLCWFDETLCEAGIKRLDGYRREWDTARGVWKDQPLHDASSHGASAFAQMARGFVMHDGNDYYEPDTV